MSQTQIPCAGPTLTMHGIPAWRLDASTLLDEPADMSPREAHDLVGALDDLSREIVERVLRQQAPCSSYIPSTCEVLACRAHAQVLDLRRAANEVGEEFAQVEERVDTMVLDAIERSAAS